MCTLFSDKEGVDAWMDCPRSGNGPGKVFHIRQSVCFYFDQEILDEGSKTVDNAGNDLPCTTS